MTTTTAGRGATMAGIAAAVLALGLGGCASPKSALGTSSSPCFRALAAAPAALHHKGRFTGVRYLSASYVRQAIETSVGEGPKLPPAIEANTAAVCAVEYRGPFSAATVSAAWPPGRAGGMLAVVVLGAKSDKVLATILVDREATHLAREL